MKSEHSALRLRQRLTSTWWLTLVWSIVFLIMGFCLLFTPFKTAVGLVSIVAIFLLIDGIIDIIGVMRHHAESGKWQLAGGIIGVVIGLLLLVNLAVGNFLTLLVAYYLLGLALIIKGIFRIVEGKQGTEWSWNHFFLGLLEVLIGLFFVANPLIGITILLFGAATLSLVGGVVLLIRGFQMRKQAGKQTSRSDGAQEQRV